VGDGRDGWKGTCPRHAHRRSCPGEAGAHHRSGSHDPLAAETAACAVTTLEAVEFATLGWVDWFNTRRLLEPLGYLPPAEQEARYCKQAAVA
jgi:hypothetical protein